MYIQKRGETYLIKISIGYENGKQKTKSTTFKPPRGLTAKQEQKAVIEAAEEFEKRIKGGASVVYDKMRFKTFALDLYMKNHGATLKPKTRAQYETIINTRLNPYFGDMFIKDITALDIRRWLSSLERIDLRGGKSALSDNSRGVWFRTLSAILGKAEEWEIIAANPCKKIKQPRKAQSEVKALETEEFKTVFAKLPEYEDIRIKAIIALLLYTGIREAEAAGLKWIDFNFKENSLQIRRVIYYINKQGLIETTPKSKAGNRKIYFPRELAIILKELKQSQKNDIKVRGDLWKGATGDNAYLFTQFDGAPIFDTTIRKWVKKYLTWAGVSCITPHGLRHTFASLLIAGGIDARTTAAQLGHSSPALVYNVYANKQSSAQRKAAAFLGALSVDNEQIMNKSPENKEN